MRVSVVLGALLGVLAVPVACREQSPRPSRDQGLAPLVARAPATLAVSGFGDAAIVAPVGITRAAPLLVAVIGIGDTPESQCAAWGEVIGQRAFVVCPRGLPHLVRVGPSPVQGEGETLDEDEAEEPAGDVGQVVPSGFRPRDVDTLEREVDAAISSVRTRFGVYVAAGPVVYAGFSRGAFLGASLIARHPEKFPHAVFVEGGQSFWTEERAATFAKGGGKRVLFACGQPSCVQEANRAAHIIAKAGVATRVVHGDGEGHGYKGPVREQVQLSFDWVVEGVPTWRQLLTDESR